MLVLVYYTMHLYIVHNYVYTSRNAYRLYMHLKVHVKNSDSIQFSYQAPLGEIWFSRRPSPQRARWQIWSICWWLKSAPLGSWLHFHWGYPGLTWSSRGKMIWNNPFPEKKNNKTYIVLLWSQKMMWILSDQVCCFFSGLQMLASCIELRTEIGFKNVLFPWDDWAGNGPTYSGKVPLSGWAITSCLSTPVWDVKSW